MDTLTAASHAALSPPPSADAVSATMIGLRPAKSE